MQRSWMITALALSVGLGANAYADNEPPAISVQDLPPFPEVREDQGLINVAVIGAQDIEEDVVVGASKREQSLGSVASAVSVISGDQVRRFGFRTLAEALSTVSGIYIVNDRMIERVGIRGVQLLGDANTRILLLIDGSPLNEPWSQYVDTSYALPVQLDDVARIEVIRGPVSSVYGTNAFLGIINIVTLGADKAPPVYGRVGGDSQGSLTGNAGFGIGSVNRQVRGSVGWVRRGAEELSYTTSVPTEPGQPPVDGSFTTNADRLEALNGAIQVHFDKLFFQVRGASRTRELPGAPYDSIIGSNANTNNDSQAIAELGYNLDLTSRLSLSARAYADMYRFSGDLQYPDANNPGTTEISQSVGTSVWYGTELRGLLDLSALVPEGSKLDVTMGVAADQSQTSSESRIKDMPVLVSIDRSFYTLGAYSEVSLEPVSWFAATAGVRFDLNSQFENNISPRTALFLKKGDRIGLKFLYAEGFRNPSIFEAFFTDNARYRPACEPNCAEDDAPTLFPELIASQEVVLWGRPFPGTKARVSVWRWDVEKLIEKRRVYDPQVLEERLQFQNLAFLESLGIEFDASYRNTRGWFGYGNVALAQVVRNGGEAPNAPAITAKAGLSTPRVFNRFHLSSDVVYVGERAARDEDIAPAPEHIAWNAALYLPALAGFDVTVGVRNILGTRQLVPAQADYDRQVPQAEDLYFVPGPGREIFGRLGYQF